MYIIYSHRVHRVHNLLTSSTSWKWSTHIEYIVYIIYSHWVHRVHNLLTSSTSCTWSTHIEHIVYIIYSHRVHPLHYLLPSTLLYSTSLFTILSRFAQKGRNPDGQEWQMTHLNGKNYKTQREWLWTFFALFYQMVQIHPSLSAFSPIFTISNRFAQKWR